MGFGVMTPQNHYQTLSGASHDRATAPHRAACPLDLLRTPLQNGLETAHLLRGLAVAPDAERQVMPVDSLAEVFAGRGGLGRDDGGGRERRHLLAVLLLVGRGLDS